MTIYYYSWNAFHEPYPDILTYILYTKDYNNKLITSDTTSPT